MPTKLLAIAVAGMLAVLAIYVVVTDAGLEYDDTGYLTRGFYHAAQVADRGSPILLRLPWSLMFEAPKPPLFHGWIALLALLLPGDAHATLLAIATVVPMALLFLVVVKLAQSAGGRVAGSFAAAALAATPLFLEIGTRLLVETMLSVLVTAATWLAAERLRRGGSALAALVVGLVGGAALLTKLLAPLFILPVMALAIFELWRGEGVRKTGLWIAVVIVGGLVVAGPWYSRNLHAALAFAQVARVHPPSVDILPRWTRPARLLAAGPGAALACGWFVLLALGRRKRSGADLRRLRAMAWTSALCSAAVIQSQPVFDPRYWLPALALLAAWAGAEAEGIWKEGARRQCLVLAAVSIALVVVSAAHLATRPRHRMAWGASSLIGELAGGNVGPLRLCELGNTPEWNVEKLRLAAELSRVRPRPAIDDLLHEGPLSGHAERLSRCDFVFAIPPEALPTEAAQVRLNIDLPQGYSILEGESAGFEPDSALSRQLGSRQQLLIFRRRIR